MATAADSVENVQKSLICQVCHESLLLNPHTLRCLHNYCGECLGKLERKLQKGKRGIFCPVCKKFSSDSDIQSNNLLQIVVEGFTHLYHERLLNIPRDARTCGQCERLTVTAYCVTCKLELCSICQSTHLKIAALQDHQVVAIGDADNPPVINTTKICPQHPGQFIKAFCKVCNIAICSDCKLESHDLHETQSVDKALADILPDVKNKFEDIRKKTRTIQSKISALDAAMISTDKNYDSIVKSAEEETLRKMELLQQELQTMKEETFVEKQAKMKEFAIAKEDLENTLSSMESILTWGEPVTELAQGPGVLYELANELMGRINTMSRTDVSFKECDNLLELQSEELKFIPFQSEGASLLGKVSKVTKQILSFRELNIDIGILASAKIERVRDVVLQQESSRICFWNNEFWFSSKGDFFIYDKQLVFQRCVKFIDTGFINAAHPISTICAVVATNIGLFMMKRDSGTHLKILDGNMLDVHVHGNNIGLLGLNSSTELCVQILDRETTKLKLTFPCEHESINTIIINDSHVFISCLFVPCVISCYDITNGTLVTELGKFGNNKPGCFNVPSLRMYHADGSLVVSDARCVQAGKQVNGKYVWDILQFPMDKTQFNDMVIVDDHIYTLYDKCVKIFSI